MAFPFVLRFQEVVSKQCREDAHGTQTHTFVRSEQGDMDSQYMPFRSIPLDTKRYESMMPSSGVAKIIIGGTQTATEVRQENADRDPAIQSFSFLPRESMQ